MSRAGFGWAFACRCSVGCATILIAAVSWALLSTDAAAQQKVKCQVPENLILSESRLPRVTKSVRDAKSLSIAIFGAGAASLPGPGGKETSYPAQLEAVLSHRLPGIAVKVGAYTVPRQTLKEVSRNAKRLLAEAKPTLVVLQTGTVDAIRRTDLDEFGEELEYLIDTIQGAGADVILVNLQYNPRLETMIPTTAYSGMIQSIAVEKDVPLFDRLGIMRYWSEAGFFDFYTPTKDPTTARQVHYCIGQALAAQVIATARLRARSASNF